MNEFVPGQFVNERQPAPAPAADQRNDGMDIDFGQIGATLKRNWWILLIFVVLALAIGTIITLRSPRLYRASATVQIEQQQAKVLSSDEEQPAVTQDADRFLQTQLSLLNSRALAIQVADQLRLGAGAPQTDEERAMTPAQRREAMLTDLQSSLNVTLPRDSRVAQITITGREPEMVAKIANAYAENFILYNLQRRVRESSYARDFLSRELEGARGRLEQSESELLNYARRYRLVDAGGNGMGNSPGDQNSRMLTTNNLLDVNTALSRAQITRIEAERKWRQSLSTPPTAIPEVMANPAIQQLLQQRASVTANYQRDRQTFRPEYPAMREMQAQISTLDSQTDRLASAVRTSLRNQYLLAAQAESALAARLESLKSETLNEQSRSIQYNILRRGVDTNRLMYDGLLQRFKEVSAAAGITANNISVVDRAEVPDRPFSPRTRMNLLSSLAAGLALGLLVILIRTKVDDLLRTPEDVTSALGLPVLGEVPTMGEEVSPQFLLEGSAMAEAFWSLRTTIEHLLQKSDQRSILVTSSRGSEGKSTIALALAQSFAQGGRQTLLVDGDLRRPSVHRMLDLPNTSGFGAVVAEEAQLENSLQYSRGLRVLPSGPLTHNPAQLLAKPHLETVLRHFRDRFDLLVFDSAPVLGLADVVLLASKLGVVLFVVESGKTRARQVKAAIKRLNANGVTVAGVILNRYDADVDRYSY